MPTDNTLQHPVRALHKCYMNIILCKLSVVYYIHMTFLENHPSGAVSVCHVYAFVHKMFLSVHIW